MTNTQTPCGTVVLLKRKTACSRCRAVVTMGVVSSCDCSTTTLCQECAMRDEFVLLDTESEKKHRKYCGRHSSN